jgi:membrane-associated phospholipid phosphatase
LPERDEQRSDKEAIEEVQQDVQESVRQETEATPVRRCRARIFQIYAFVAIVGFLVLAFFVSTSANLPLDVTLTRDFQSLTSFDLTVFMNLVSWPGYTPQAIFIVLGLVIVIYFAGLRWEAVAAGLGALGVQAINLLVKYAVHRPRPSSNLVEVARKLSGYSFPSGHVMFYTAFFGFLAFLAYTLFRPSWIRTVLVAFFSGLVIFVGPSRVYLGAHWSSDVLGGYLLGSLGLLAIIRVYSWGKDRFFTDQLRAPQHRPREQHGEAD